MLECPELFAFLGGFQGAGGQFGNGLEKIPAKGINAQMLVIGGIEIAGQVEV
jgi:hypothetical protein